MKRNRTTDVDENARIIAAAFAMLRESPAIIDGSPEDTALCQIETFCDVALRLMAKCNPSKVRDCARTVEIKARMDGTPVLDGPTREVRP